MKAESNPATIMTPEQVTLIEDSWDYIIINATQAGDLFYQKLFEIDPSLRLLFKENIKVQAHKLTSMITFLVHKLSTFDAVAADVRALGKRHKNYNVKQEHYSVVKKALLSTLKLGLEDQWTDDTGVAWTKLYDLLASIMVESSQ